LFKENYLKLTIIVLIINLFLDRVTKVLAYIYLKGEQPITFFSDTMRLVYAENIGAFLSMGANWPITIKYIVLLFIPTAVCFYGIYYYAYKEADKTKIILIVSIIGGGLAINFKIKVNNDNLTEKDLISISKFLVVEPESIEGVDIIWGSLNENGLPSLSADKLHLEASMVYSQLPVNNNLFGLKNVILKNKNIELIKEDYEIFYDKFGQDHPNNKVGQPNWFYYWKEGEVLPVLKTKDILYDKNLPECGIILEGNEEAIITIGPKAIDYVYQQVDDPSMPGVPYSYGFTNKIDAMYTQYYSSYPISPLDALCTTIAHEEVHETIYNDRISGEDYDRDGDGVCDSEEVFSSYTGDWATGYLGFTTINVYATSPFALEPDTWDLYKEFGAIVYKTYGDNELRARMNESTNGQTLRNSFRRNHNWSNDTERGVSNYGY